MNSLRQSRSQEKGGSNTHSVEVCESNHKQELENLEARRLSTTDWPALCSLEPNRFAALSVPDEDDDEVELKCHSKFDYHSRFDCHSQSDCHSRFVCHEKSDCQVELICLSKSDCQTEVDCHLKPDCQEHVLLAVDESKTGDAFWITVDSGASENVISPTLAPQFRVKPSRGSAEGLKYVTANGSVMANKGEKDLRVITEEGHRCTLRMQVTDVQKPLMSVARICDAGHRVTFTRDGGVIESENTGVKTHFNRVDNVYRLRVGLSAGDADFSRQGA